MLKSMNSKTLTNINSAFNKNTNSSAFGFVLRNFAGTILLHFGKRVSVESAFESEAMALVEAIKAADHWQGEQVQFESDCLNLVHVINDGWSCVS